VSTVGAAEGGKEVISGLLGSNGLWVSTVGAAEGGKEVISGLLWYNGLCGRGDLKIYTVDEEVCRAEDSHYHTINI
jgi:hypothetical protein